VKKEKRRRRGEMAMKRQKRRRGEEGEPVKQEKR